jgi:hypothetical protein
MTASCFGKAGGYRLIHLCAVVWGALKAISL